MARNYRTAPLEARTRAMLEYCVELTLRPWECSAADVQRLRDYGYDDGDILDIVQIVGFFNYINRVADGLGCDPEPFMTAWVR
ncbi:MAG: peroxidase [Armatimonadetes bacterium]|nr:peroxidase [Armatimonadota bacterium]